MCRLQPDESSFKKTIRDNFVLFAETEDGRLDFRQCFKTYSACILLMFVKC